MTNDDKDLKQQLIELAWEIEKLPASEQQTKVITMLTDIRSKATPQQPQRQDSLTDQMETVKTLARNAGCYDALDWLNNNFGKTQQPSKPLKELDKHEMVSVLLNVFAIGSLYRKFDNGTKLMIAEEICKHFALPSEKKALSREELKKLVDEETKQMFDNLIFITKKMEEMEKQYFEAKKALPNEKKALSVEEIIKISKKARKDYEHQSKEFWNEDGEEYAVAKAINSTMPAQREVRYPEKKEVHGCNHSCGEDGCHFCSGCFDEGRNDAIDEFKKLNGG